MVDSKFVHHANQSDSEALEYSPATRKGQGAEPSSLVDRERIRRVSRKKAQIGEPSQWVVTSLTFQLTIWTDMQAEKDKENTQQKKMACLQAQNAKMKRKLKAKANVDATGWIKRHS
jgi:hypothetical protein